MARISGSKRTLPSSFLPSQSPGGRSGSRRRLTSPNTQSEGSTIAWSSSPPRSMLKRANEKYQESTSTLRDCEYDGRDTTRLFQSEPIRAELTTTMESFPFEQDQSVYTSQHPLIHRVRNLLRSRAVGCALCAFYEWGPIVNTHKLKRCSHRDEANEAQPWLDMFRKYQAHGGGPGARCAHCRFPIMLCLRTAYREQMDLQYGSETEARENEDFLYAEVQCDWVKTMQRFVTSCMVFHGRGKECGVSRLGGTVLDMMGWKDWKGLEENGPEHIRKWLEEMDEMRGLRCPRLLKLFWLLAENPSKD
ncbi:hypothetical protein Forpe1208_v012145 [Fusarium oxysporum f. sp. rapae]|uniref:Uncharacterized protein n=1 Tax=Fusarium oxysporum f. sp. rapae TaxID=485398 RepID=A0A8J5NP51_FUSOX|nr:hypothetical protein Forpe1208_v012141 [Fusarium oxysporum f. sp. rapae]KAG7408764.1 hypothetical protein Forpe1208_v012145 [Fusarium oxysporum f. sp. rapae]